MYIYGFLFQWLLLKIPLIITIICTYEYICELKYSLVCLNIKILLTATSKTSVSLVLIYENFKFSEIVKICNPKIKALLYH